MKKNYDSTIDEAVYAHFRLAGLAGTISQYKWYGLVWTPVIFIAMYSILPSTQLVRVVSASLISLAFVLLHLSTYKIGLRKRIRKMLVKAMGTDKPVPCEYEMDEDGLVFRKMGQEMKFSWTRVTVLIDTVDSIEVIMDPTAIAIIPKRIFTEPAELQEWIAFIEDHKNRDKAIEEKKEKKKT